MDGYADKVVRMDALQVLHKGNAARTVLAPQTSDILKDNALLGCLQHGAACDDGVRYCCRVVLTVHKRNVEHHVRLTDGLTGLDGDIHIQHTAERSLEVHVDRLGSLVRLIIVKRIRNLAYGIGSPVHKSDWHVHVFVRRSDGHLRLELRRRN